MESGFYKAFEDRHRGSRDLIISRLHVYLPFIEKLKEFYPESQAADLGCGRGEWLELLKNNEVEGFGVDIDENMLADCKALGLHVATQDALSFLQSLPDESQVVISAFHLVEHIGLSEVRKLVQEALRVLKPAGLLILETPNPENIVVGSSGFYMDPTHQRPIPSDLLIFICDYYGFERTKVLRLQESKELASSSPINILDVLVGVSPDYAIVAQKGGNNELLKAMDSLFARDYGITLEQLAKRYDVQQNEREQKQQELQEQHQHLQEKYQSISREIYDLKHGRLWRITAPLRRVGDLERYLKQRYLQKNSRRGRLSPKNIKLTLKKLLICIAGQSLRVTSSILRLLPQLMHQSLKVRVLSFLGHFPWLKTFLKRLHLASLGYLARESNLPTELQHLSPRARKIYSDLQATAARQQRGGN